MRIDELKSIAEENDYTIRLDDEFNVYKLVRKVSKDDTIVNFISIGTDIKGILFVNAVHSDEKDLNMIKASVEFAETPITERGDYEN